MLTHILGKSKQLHKMVKSTALALIRPKKKKNKHTKNLKN